MTSGESLGTPILENDDFDLAGLDRPIIGALAIGREACIFKKDKKSGKIKRDENGEPEVDVRKSFYLIGIGAIAVKHVKGRNKDGTEKARGQLVSSPRMIRDSLLGGVR